MEYVKGAPFFMQGEKIKQYPYLNTDIECEILIVGGGINGAILNYYLSKSHSVILVEKDRLGMGCTSCATALLEYQLDDFASDLKSEMTTNEIVEVYRMGLESIKKIKQFISQNGNFCDFALRPTLLYSTSKCDKKKILEEYNFRVQNGFECELITRQNNLFPFDIEYGLYCKNGGAELNPYLFTKQLIENSQNQQYIFENTKIESFENADDFVTAKTNYGQTIKCKTLILATGFNWELIDPKALPQRTVSYTIVTTKNSLCWESNALVQDNKKPYHYMRKLPCGRIIFGGEDTKFNNKCIKAKTASKKYKALEKALKTLFGGQQDKICVEYKFCGCFGETKNNLGMIGKSKEKNIFYFFSNGANGIVNAVFATNLIEDILNEKDNKFEKLFSPLRYS